MTSSETPVTDYKYGEQLSYDPEFHGPVKSRGCTDILCLFLFVAFLAGWLVVAFFAFREGDPRVLIYPTDSAGNICGIGKLESKPYLLFFDLMKCNSPRVVFTGCPTPQVCVEQCPNETFYASKDLSNDYKDKLVCEYHVDKSKKSIKELVSGGQCAELYLKSNPILRRCIPEAFHRHADNEYVTDSKNKTLKNGNDEGLKMNDLGNATALLAKFLSVGEMGEKMFSDFRTSWKFLLLGVFFAMVVSLVWIVVMRWVAAPMVWLSIVLVLAFLVYGCYYSTIMFMSLKNVEGADAKLTVTVDLKSYLALRKTWLAFAIITGILFAVLFLVILFLRKRIYIAIALIKQGSRAVATMPTSLIFPLVPYAGMLVFLIFWAAVALYIASSGKASFVLADVPDSSDLKNGSTCNPSLHNITGTGIKCLFQTYGLKDNLFTSHIYNAFGLFWGMFFSVGVGQVALAGVFASYYWTRNKDNIAQFAMCQAFYKALRYHLGSVAFGSLLIATIRTIRVIIEYIDNKLRKYPNPVTKALIWCCRCFCWCLEVFLKFISKNAYIMIAIYGTNFCSSAKKAFFLLMRNILRVVVVDKLTDFLLLIGKLVVVAITGAASFYFFSTKQTVYKGVPPLNYNLLPPIVISIGAYLIASVFFSVYGMAIDTLFLCFLEDCERNDGSTEKPYFMSKELMKILHKKNKFRELSPSSDSPKR